MGVTVDFDSKYKIVWGEARVHGMPGHEEEKIVQNKNLHNYFNISTPYKISLTHVGEEGVSFLADCLRSTQIWPVDSSCFDWLIKT